jgi:UDP-N-acetylmuramoyl-tripeptide--D-alanyl-D-alanine ligase
MKLKNFLYLVQLEEYDINRVKAWLKNNPGREVLEIKKSLVWTTKIKILYTISSLLFFLPSQTSVFLTLNLIQPIDNISKYILVLIAKVKLIIFHRQLKTIAITGSWGKTTVKETLLPSLSKKYRTAATTANQNTLIGVSLRILKLPVDTQIFICEAGAYYPGDIKQICQLVSPQIGIITAIGSMHLERFGSLANIRKTKMELAESIPKTGHLYLPADQKNSSLINFSIKTKNILFFKQLTDVYQSLARLLDIDSISPIASSDHRLEIIKNGSMNIIDDTYNSNPVGFAMALDKLKSLKSKNNILVTPGMIELGDIQATENTRLAKMAGSFCQHIIIVGHTNRQALLAGLKNTSATIHLLDHTNDTLELLPRITSPDTAVLFENDLPDNYF